MKFYRQLFLLCLLLICVSGFYTDSKSSFSFKKSEQGIELFENGYAVFFYQRKPKSSDGRYMCNNYLHPLYSIDGDTLTEEFPADHPFHRGIFWAWHQVFIDNQSIGDDWIMQNISQDVVGLKTHIQQSTASLETDVNWKSSAWQNGKAFVKERSTILVHGLKEDSVRTIDFEISLTALVPGVSIGGSDDEKGYGGFCTRIKCPEDLVFTSAKGPVIPQDNQVEAGPWMDFSGSFGPGKKISGLTLICHPTTPNYPAPWILRQSASMQNIVFPGRKGIDLQMNKPIVLRYRIVIHKGTSANVDMIKMLSEYQKTHSRN
jgi:hypothetical protein